MLGVEIPEGSARRLAFKCPACQAELLPAGKAPDDTEKAVISDYPVLIAQPFARMLGKTEVEAKVKALVDVFTNVLKYLGLIVEAEYLRDGKVNDETLNTIIAEDLDCPLVSSWNAFLGAALPALERSGHEFFVPELKPFYDSVEKKIRDADRVKVEEAGYYDDEGELVPTCKAMGLIEALVNYRNNFIHNITRPEDEAVREFETHLGVLKNLLGGMSWCTRYPLLRREGKNALRLMGAEPSEAGNWPEEARQAGILLHNPEAGEYLPLEPFFVASRDPKTGPGELGDLLVYDQKTEEHILYLSPIGQRWETASTLPAWRALMERKGIGDVGR